MSKLISKYWKNIIWIILGVLIILNINAKFINTVSTKKQLEYLSNVAIDNMEKKENNK